MRPIDPLPYPRFADIVDPGSGYASVPARAAAPPLPADEVGPWTYPPRPDSWLPDLPLAEHLAACLLCTWTYDEREGLIARRTEAMAHLRQTSHPVTWSPWPPLDPSGVPEARTGTHS